MIKDKNNRKTYKIFKDNEELEIYLNKNKNKICEKMNPIFKVEEYIEYHNTKVKRLSKVEIEKYIEEIKQLEKRAETLFDYLNLKYRLSEREIKVVVMYYGLDGHEKKAFSQIAEATKIDDDNLDKILKGAMFKLSTVDEKVEL